MPIPASLLASQEDLDKRAAQGERHWDNEDYEFNLQLNAVHKNMEFLLKEKPSHAKLVELCEKLKLEKKFTERQSQTIDDLHNALEAEKLKSKKLEEELKKERTRNFQL
ncbi:hypothetical protein CRE_24191 [Caenorhabditis remanei]|uniref:Uncharacterized protein n=1 Tax=Caenorhabditis remanei TaxID=31234 RepID=E3N992_CAERE|nr:hypothetical protein CRE_24191 [Caenorhabditis remanei]